MSYIFETLWSITIILDFNIMPILDSFYIIYPYNAINRNYRICCNIYKITKVSFFVTYYVR